MRIAGAALNQTPIDWPNNLRNIQEAIAQAKAAGVQLLCLPELCLTGYGCEDLFLSDWLPEAALAHLQSIRPWTEGICVAVGLPVRLAGRTYNTAAVLRDGDILGFAAKQFLANDGVHYEPRFFAPWPAGQTTTVSLGAETWALGDLTFMHLGVGFGFEICEDAWRPDDVRPAARLRGRADLIINPSASHFAMSKTDVRHRLVVDASRNFHCTYLYANLLGNEAGRITYDGEILIAQHGHLLKRNSLLSFKEVDLEWADVDFASPPPPAAAFVPLPAPDEFRELNQALALALFDYLRKARSRGFVLSLSGGADSSLCAVAVAEMVRLGVEELGEAEFVRRGGFFRKGEQIDAPHPPPTPTPFVEEWDKVSNETHEQLYGWKLDAEYDDEVQLTDQQQLVNELLTCVYQSTENSSYDTFCSAEELAKQIGARFHEWSIDPEVAGYVAKIEQALGRKLTWETDDLALQNIQARVRAPGIWLLSNVQNCLLLTTSNRSEASVGYCTMDGDTAGSISPIAGVDKDFVKQWLRWAETTLGYAALRHVNALEPTAELRPLADGQTDERDLMPYTLLNRIERLAFFERLAPAAVLARLDTEETGFDHAQLRAYVRRFYTLWSRNQWKRERYAPSFHLDDYNVDPRSWLRFPILSGGFDEELAAL